MRRPTRPWSWLLALACATLVLSGCASSRMVDSDVQRFAGAKPLAIPASYRFERLPSQAQNPAQDRIESMSETALAAHQLTRTTAPQYTVQVELQSTERDNPYDGHRHVGSSGWGWGVGIGVGNHGSGLGLFWNAPTPWYQHSLRILIRDKAGAVAYESKAVHHGPWSDSLNLLPALLDAALRDFPNGSGGSVREVVELAEPPRD